MISVGALTPILVCFDKLEITPPANFNQSCDGTEGVKRDWEMFVKHVTRFGIVVFHDTIWDITPPNEWTRSDMGVPRFVDELRQQGYQILTIGRDYGVSIVQPIIGGIPLR